jgi:hypothetical protein
MQMRFSVATQLTQIGVSSEYAVCGSAETRLGTALVVHLNQLYCNQRKGYGNESPRASHIYQISGNVRMDFFNAGNEGDM